MADRTLPVGGVFPDGITVGVYARTTEPAATSPPGPEVTSAVVTNGSVALTGLEDGGRYWVEALVSGGPRYIAFDMPAGVQPGTVDLVDLRFDPETQAEADALQAALVAADAAEVADRAAADTSEATARAAGDTAEATARAAAIAAHAADTTAVHGIANTADVAVMREAPLNVEYPEFGAVGDGSMDDGAALQAAFTAAGALNGQTVFVPPGGFRYTAALSVPAGMSLMGAGRSSVLKPEGCNGLEFAVSDLIGPQRFEKFYIEGDGTYAHEGVTALGDADAGRVQGITFKDVFLSNLKSAFHLRSTHGWVFEHVTGIFLWQGVRIAGQSILPTIGAGCEFSRDGATGTGESRGLIVESASDYAGATERGPEGIRVTGAEFFGFDVAIDHVLALDSVYKGLTLGAVTGTAMRITSTQGGLRFRDSWIGYGDGALYGIHALPLGAPIAGGRVVIDGIHAEAEAGQTVDANHIGCALDTNQYGTVRDTTLRGSGLHDLRLNFAGPVALRDVECLSSGLGSHGVQLVAFPGGPYYLDNVVSVGGIFEHASNAPGTTIRTDGTATP